jgi:dUTP pyrophosphatase
MEVKIKLENENAVMPVYKHETDACADIHSADYVIIEPGDTEIIDTGVVFEVPYGYELQVRSRSGLAAKNGIFCLNSPGTIDCFTEDSKLNLVSGVTDFSNIKINDKILSYNEKSNKIEQDTISCIVNTGEQEVFCFETNDGILKVTGGTKVYTTKGIKFARDLTENDVLLSF